MNQYPPGQPYQQMEPQPKPKNSMMKTFSILSFIAFLVLIGLSVFVAHDFSTTVVALLGCSGFLMFAAGFVFLCLI